MKVHILGICGTFMGGIAAIARELGHEVSGSDQGVYPPMSDTLRSLGVTLKEGYLAENLQPQPDLVIIGNALSRGNPAVEYVLDQNIPYVSGPQWLSEQVLQKRHVLAVAGTHGKTSTTAMLTWVMQYAGLNPGYLIGGVAKDFEKTCALGDSDYFVIEADEYDTAFFDKRSKFLHYRPRTLILNNLEFDHADIFADLDAIKLQFQYLLRSVPAAGQIISNGDDENLDSVLDRGCWSRKTGFSLRGNIGWTANNITDDYANFDVYFDSELQGSVNWKMFGRYNIANALAAIAATVDLGVDPKVACEALSQFGGLKRRMELRGMFNGISVYDDFAHHPTAIAETLDGLRKRVGQDRIIAILQFGSNTMKAGEHGKRIATALKFADEVILLEPADFDLVPICIAIGPHAKAFASVDEIVVHAQQITQPGDHVLVMSNKGFGGIHKKLLGPVSISQD